MYRRTMGGLSEKKVLWAAAVFFLAVLLIGGSVSGFAKAGSSRESSYKYYTSVAIQRGDTLWSIAADYMPPEYDGIEEYISEVRRLNHLYDDSIYAGGYLTIPQYSAHPEPDPSEENFKGIESFP